MRRGRGEGGGELTDRGGGSGRSGLSCTENNAPATVILELDQLLTMSTFLQRRCAENCRKS